MLRPIRLPLTCALGVALFLAVGCTDPDVTNVGSILVDGGAAGEAPDAEAPDSSTGSDAANVDSAVPPDAKLDAPMLDAQPDGQPPCVAGACGSKVCGRDECGNICGQCPSPGAQGGCFMGACIVASPGNECPGTPCLDQNGEQICEGERGGVACVGGTLGVQVCTCTGGGPSAWASCGACL